MFLHSTYALRPTPDTPDTIHLHETFYYLLGRFRKPQRAQRHAEKNNDPLRLSASSAVNLFCRDPFTQNKLKSHICTRIIDTHLMLKILKKIKSKPRSGFEPE